MKAMYMMVSGRRRALELAKHHICNWQFGVAAVLLLTLTFDCHGDTTPTTKGLIRHARSLVPFCFTMTMDNYPKYVPSSPYSSPYSNDVHQDARRISRTPSPSPSEIQALNQKGFFNWKSIFDKKNLWSKKRISASSFPYNFNCWFIGEQLFILL
jgi:hypothetical protein